MSDPTSDQTPNPRVRVNRIPRTTDARDDAAWEQQEDAIMDMLRPYRRRVFLREYGRSLLGLLEAVLFILATGVAVGIAVHIATH